jgi:hypothetical protein
MPLGKEKAFLASCVISHLPVGEETLLDEPVELTRNQIALF